MPGFEALLPRRLKDALKDRLARLVAVEWGRHPESPGVIPIRPGETAYLIPARPVPAAEDALTGLDVPPRELWHGYGTEAKDYLEGGHRDMQVLCEELEAAGRPIADQRRVLDFGCAAGRMTRWLADRARAGAEVWGADLSGPHIAWCREHLSPPLHFALTTAQPHLPFEDRHFDLIFAGSVFTHLDDLAETWLLELRRVLRPGGTLAFSIHDCDTLAALEAQPDHWLWRRLTADPRFEAYRRAEFGMFTIGRASQAQVFYDRDYLEARLSPWYRPLRTRPLGYGEQTLTLWTRHDLHADP